jgi:hypothetical protein
MFGNLPEGNNVSGRKLPERDTPLRYSINLILQAVAAQSRSIFEKIMKEIRFPLFSWYDHCSYKILERQNPLVLPLQRRLNDKVQVKFTLEQATKVQSGSTGIGLQLLFL